MIEPQFNKVRKMEKSDFKIVNTVGKMKKLKPMHNVKEKIRKKSNIQRKSQPHLFKETVKNKILNKWD